MFKTTLVAIAAVVTLSGAAQAGVCGQSFNIDTDVSEDGQQDLSFGLKWEFGQECDQQIAENALDIQEARLKNDKQAIDNFSKMIIAFEKLEKLCESTNNPNICAKRDLMSSEILHASY